MELFLSVCIIDEYIQIDALKYRMYVEKNVQFQNLSKGNTKLINLRLTTQNIPVFIAF